MELSNPTSIRASIKGAKLLLKPYLIGGITNNGSPPIQKDIKMPSGHSAIKAQLDLTKEISSLTKILKISYSGVSLETHHLLQPYTDLTVEVSSPAPPPTTVSCDFMSVSTITVLRKLLPNISISIFTRKPPSIRKLYNVLG